MPRGRWWILVLLLPGCTQLEFAGAGPDGGDGDAASMDAASMDAPGDGPDMDAPPGDGFARDRSAPDAGPPEPHVVWVHAVGGEGLQELHDVAVLEEEGSAQLVVGGRRRFEDGGGDLSEDPVVLSWTLQSDGRLAPDGDEYAPAMRDSGSGKVHAIAASNGGIVAGGSFINTLDFGDGEVTASSASDAFLVWLDRSLHAEDGTVTTLGDDGTSDEVTAVVDDPRGAESVIATGRRDTTFLAGAQTPGGTWSSVAPSSDGGVRGLSVDVNGSGRACFAGVVDTPSGTLTVGSDQVNADIGDEQGFATCLNLDGPSNACLGSLSAEGNDRVQAVGVHGGDVFIAGFAAESGGCDGEPSLFVGRAGLDSCEIEESGFVCAKQPDLDPGEQPQITDLFVGDGGVYVTGTIDKATQFGDDGDPLENPEGGSDTFVTRLTHSMGHVWSLSFHGDGLLVGRTITVHNDRVYVAGYFNSEPDFGGCESCKPTTDADADGFVVAIEER